MVSVLSLACPVCGAPFTPGAERCGYCGSILVLHTDHPRIDPRTLNRAVVDQHIASLREELSSDPNSVRAHYGLGVAYFNLGLTDAAIASLEKASSLTPENPHIHTQLAVAWREEAKTGNASAIEEMRDHIRYALRLDPANVEALILASEEARRDHDIEQAVSLSERAWKAESERARELHERMLRLWIAWKRQRREVTDADLRRVATFSPALAEELMERPQPVSNEIAAQVSALSTTTRPMGTGIAPVLRATLIAFLAGLGLFLILCVALVTIAGQLPEDSNASAFVGLLLLALMSLPGILAWRAWDKARKKTSSS